MAIPNRNKRLAPLAKEVASKWVIQKFRELLASESFRKKATQDEIRDIERALLQAESALQRYHNERSGGGDGASVGAMATTTSADPVSAAVALVVLAIGAVALIHGPGGKEAARALDDALERLRDRINQIAGRSGAAVAGAGVAVATATVVQATALDTLGQILGLPPGQLKPVSKGTLDIIRRGIAALLAGSPPPRCKDLANNYQTQLRRANNAISGGGVTGQSSAIWTDFVNAALALARCLTEGGGPGSGAAPT